MIRTTVALAIILSALPLQSAFAAETQPSNQARNGELTILQLASDDHERFLREWDQPTPPRLTTTSSIPRNKPIVTFIIYGGCKGDEKGQCNLTADFEVIPPSGPAEADDIQRGAPIAVGVDAPTSSNLFLSQAFLGFIADKDDPLGKYRVRVTTTDNVAKLSVTTESEFELTE